LILNKNLRKIYPVNNGKKFTKGYMSVIEYPPRG